MFTIEEEVKYRNTFKEFANFQERAIEEYTKNNIRVIKGGKHEVDYYLDVPGTIRMKAICNNCGHRFIINNNDVFKVKPCPNCGTTKHSSEKELYNGKKGLILN